LESPPIENVREAVGVERVVSDRRDQVLPTTILTSFFWAKHETANTRIPDQSNILFNGISSLLKWMAALLVDELLAI